MLKDCLRSPTAQGPGEGAACIRRACPGPDGEVGSEWEGTGLRESRARGGGGQDGQEEGREGQSVRNVEDPRGRALRTGHWTESPEAHRESHSGKVTAATRV